MVEKEIIIRRLTFLEEYCHDLSEARENLSWEQFQQDKIMRRYVERTLHLAIEGCLYLANHIISYEGYREPADNKDVFGVLHEVALIEEGLAEKLKKMAQFRNVVVHDYTRIEPEIVYDILQKHLADILDFTQVIKVKFL